MAGQSSSMIRIGGTVACSTVALFSQALFPVALFPGSKASGMV